MIQYPWSNPVLSESHVAMCVCACACACVYLYRDIKIPETGKIYSFNEGNYGLWDPSVKAYMDSLKDANKWGGKPYSARYIGSLVGDFHRTLLYGGIYGYPGGFRTEGLCVHRVWCIEPTSFDMSVAQHTGLPPALTSELVMHCTLGPAYVRVSRVRLCVLPCACVSVTLAGDTKNKNGKLRLLYECAPMSFLAEQAGGLGSTGTKRVLDIVPEAIHQRVPLYIGSKKEVSTV